METISVSHITGISALEIHNTEYNFNSTAQRLLDELKKELAPFILDFAYHSGESGLTLTVYYWQSEKRI